MKKLKYFLLILVFATVSCGIVTDRPNHDPQFNPVLEQFRKDAKYFDVNVPTRKVSIQFGDVTKPPRFLGLIKLVGGNKNNVDGYCGTIAKGRNGIGNFLGKLASGPLHETKFIIINERLRDAPPRFLETLVYHELGHCMLGYGHDDSRSVMDIHSGITEFGKDRLFQLEAFFRKKVYTSKAMVILRSQPDENIEKVYEVDYEAFGERIKNRTFYDPVKGRYMILEGE